MFIYSMRAGTIRFFGIVCVALAALIALIAFVPELQPVAAGAEVIEPAQTVSFEKIRSNEDRIAFLGEFGWQVDANAAESTTVTIPREFDKVFAAYNELQKEQGLNLLKFKNKEVTHYTFSITNYADYNGTVYANVLVYRNKVIGGDVCSADVSGFIHGFEGK